MMIATASAAANTRARPNRILTSLVRCSRERTDKTCRSAWCRVPRCGRTEALGPEIVGAFIALSSTALDLTLARGGGLAHAASGSAILFGQSAGEHCRTGDQRNAVLLRDRPTPNGLPLRRTKRPAAAQAEPSRAHARRAARAHPTRDTPCHRGRRISRAPDVPRADPETGASFAIRFRAGPDPCLRAGPRPRRRWRAGPREGALQGLDGAFASLGDGRRISRFEPATMAGSPATRRTRRTRQCPDRWRRFCTSPSGAPGTPFTPRASDLLDADTHPARPPAWRPKSGPHDLAAHTQHGKTHELATLY